MMKRKYFTEEERKEARKKYNKEYLLNHKKERNEYLQVNKEKINLRTKKYYENHKKELRQYYEDRKEEINLRTKRYHQTHKKERKNYYKQYYKNNKEKINLKNNKYRQTHKEETKVKSKEYWDNHKEERYAYNKKYYNDKMKTDINFKLAHNLRSRLQGALKGNQKSGSAVKDLGCSIPELKTYLESKFQEGMTWNNWSFTGWHIDHIIPLSTFDLSNREEFLKANHYTNLQPLWAEENLSKNDKIINNSRLGEQAVAGNATIA